MGSGQSSNKNIKPSSDAQSDITQQQHHQSQKSFSLSRPSSSNADKLQEIKKYRSPSDNMESQNITNEANQFINDKKYSKSLDLYDQALQIDSENIEALFGKAFALRELEKYLLAFQICDTILQIDPTYTNVIVFKGDIYTRQGKFEEAIHQYDQALIIETENFDALHGKAFCLSELGDYQSALAIYDNLYQRDSYNQDLIRNRANVQIMLDLEDIVIEQLVSIVKHQPENEDLRLTLGLAYCKQSNFQKAVECCDFVISINNTNYLAHLHKGDALVKQGKFSEAIKSYEYSLKYNSECADSYFGKGIALKEKQQYTEALLFFDKALKYNQKYLPAIHNKGNIYMKLKKYPDALKCYDFYLAQEQNPKLYFLKAMALKQLSQYEQSLDCLRIVINKDGNDLIAKLQQGIVLYEMRMINESQAIFESLELLQYPDYRVYYYLGNCYIKKENYQQAISTLQQAILINPNNKEARICLARLQFKLYLYDDALISFNILLQQFEPQNIDFLLSKAISLYYLDQYQESNQVLDQILKIDSKAYQSYYYKSLIQFRLQKYPLSLELIDKALGINQKYVEGFLHKIEILKKLARLEDTLKIYNLLINLDKNCSEYYYRKSVILFQMFKTHDALEEINNALNLDDQNQSYIQHKANIMDALERQYQYANAVIYILAPFLGFGGLGLQYDEESLKRKYAETITLMEIRQGVRFAQMENFYSTIKVLLESIYGQNFSSRDDNIKQVLDKYYKKFNQNNQQLFVQAIVQMINDVQLARQAQITNRIKSQTLTNNLKLVSFIREIQRFNINIYNSPVGQLALEDSFRILGFMFQYNKEILGDNRAIDQQIVEIFKGGEVDLIAITKNKRSTLKQ